MSISSVQTLFPLAEPRLFRKSGLGVRLEMFTKFSKGFIFDNLVNYSVFCVDYHCEIRSFLNTLDFEYLASEDQQVINTWEKGISGFPGFLI